MSEQNNDKVVRIAFPIPSHFALEIEQAIRNIRLDPRSNAYAKQGVEVIITLIDMGLDFYFLEAVRRMQLNKLGQQVITLSIRTARRGIGTAVKQIVTKLSATQMLAIADFIEELFVDLPSVAELADTDPDALPKQHNQKG